MTTSFCNEVKNDIFYHFVTLSKETVAATVILIQLPAHICAQKSRSKKWVKFWWSVAFFKSYCEKTKSIIHTL